MGDHIEQTGLLEGITIQLKKREDFERSILRRQERERQRLEMDDAYETGESEKGEAPLTQTEGSSLGSSSSDDLDMERKGTLESGHSMISRKTVEVPFNPLRFMAEYLSEK